MFDNEEYDWRTPQDWLSLGYEKGLTTRKPIPAKALLSVGDKTSSGTTHTHVAFLREKSVFFQWSSSMSFVLSVCLLL